MEESPSIPLNQLEASSQEQYAASHQQFNHAFEVAQQAVPELQLNHEATQQAGAEIINTFGVRAELFKDPARSLVFSCIADRWSKIADKEPDRQEAERDFLSDATALLAHEYADNLQDAHDAIAEKSGRDEADILRAYDKYTDQQLTEELNGRIKNGLLDSVKQRLGVTAENEDQYEVRVLSINGHDGNYMGLSDEQIDWDNVPKDWNETQKIIDEHNITKNITDDHWKRLADRAEEFAKAIGSEGLFAPAWVTRLEGKTLLCLPQPVAEKILDQSLTENTPWYSQDDWERDFAFIEHEYTHTQGGFNLDHGVQYGINIEEVRAEFYSGNKQGYHDVKGLFQDISLVTGENMRNGFDGLEKGGTAAEMYASIAKAVGVDNTLDVLLAVPLNYAKDQTNPYIGAAINHIGGYDGIIQRLIDREVKAGRSEEFEVRLNEKLERVTEICQGDPVSLLELMKNYGTSVIPDLLLNKHSARPLVK